MTTLGFTIVRGDLAVNFRRKSDAKKALPMYGPDATIVPRTSTAVDLAAKRRLAAESQKAG